MSKELQFNRIYEQTKDFGRTQFVREIQMQINGNKRLQQENKELKKEIRKYQKDRDINTKRHLEVQDYIKSRIQYCKEMTGFDCCIEELEEISKMV